MLVSSPFFMGSKKRGAKKSSSLFIDELDTPSKTGGYPYDNRFW